MSEEPDLTVEEIKELVREMEERADKDVQGLRQWRAFGEKEEAHPDRERVANHAKSSRRTGETWLIGRRFYAVRSLPVETTGRRSRTVCCVLVPGEYEESPCSLRVSDISHRYITRG